MNATIDFNIYYRTRKLSIQADTLSRDQVLKDDNYLTKPYNIVNIAALQQATFNNDFANYCKTQYTKEELIQQYSKMGPPDIYKENNLFYISNRLCPPKLVHREVIRKEPNTVHWGRDKTIEIINQNFNINNLYRKVSIALAKYNPYQWNKNSTHNRYGLLNPLELPSTLWKSISIDFIIKRPKTRRGNEYI
jgi:hypothetical protein